MLILIICLYCIVLYWGVGCMGKTPHSFSISERNDEHCKGTNVNMSQVVDSFLDSYFAEGRSETAALELRLESLRRQREELQTELDRLESEITTVQGALEDHRGELNERINSVAAEFADRPEVIDANHVAVRDIASEFDMNAEQVANRIRGRME